MKSSRKTHAELERTSRKAMKIQIDSHRIEGIRISKRDAEKIRQEVLAEYATTALAKP